MISIILRKMIFVTCLLAIGVSSPIFTQTSDDQISEHVDVWVIGATKHKGPKVRFDPALRGLQKDLVGLPYNRFKLLKKNDFNLKVGQRSQIAFMGPKKRQRAMWVERLAGKKKNKMRFQISIPAIQFKTVVSLKRGSFMMLGGPQSDKGTLVFALKAL